MTETHQNENWLASNQKVWDQKANLHVKSAFYDMEAFMEGACSLNEAELEALGDVTGKRMLHLQCHFGQDTLSWARRGAEVTGVDLSPEAIRIAKETAQKLNLEARFIQSNVLELPEVLHGPDETFDIVFSTYGTICWLPDMDEWAALVARYLRPGGKLFLAEFHPVIDMIEFENMTLGYPYFNKGMLSEETGTTYTGQAHEAPAKEYFWNHPLSEVINALINAGLQVTSLREFEYSYYNCFPNMKEISPGKYQFEGPWSLAPHMYALEAMK